MQAFVLPTGRVLVPVPAPHQWRVEKHSAGAIPGLALEPVPCYGVQQKLPACIQTRWPVRQRVVFDCFLSDLIPVSSGHN